MQYFIRSIVLFFIMNMLASPVFAKSNCDVMRMPLVEKEFLSAGDRNMTEQLLTFGSHSPTRLLKCTEDMAFARFFLTTSFTLPENQISYGGRLYFKIPDKDISDSKNYAVYVTFNIDSHYQGDTDPTYIYENGQRIFPAPPGPAAVSTSDYVANLAELRVLVKKKSSETASNLLTVSPTSLGNIRLTHGDTTYDFGATNITFQIGFTTETCVVESKNILLPKVSASSLNQLKEVGATEFNINVNCPNALDNSMSYAVITDVNNAIANSAGQLKNIGAAKNVGIKLYTDHHPVMIGAAPYSTPVFINKDDNVSQIVPNAFEFGSVVWKNANRKFKVVYEKIGNDAIGFGTVEAEARIDVFYP